MQSKREALIDAAKSLLWERGYEAMSPRAVLARSGAGQGSLYHHFAGKAALAADALEQVAAEMIGNFDAAFGADLPPLQRIERYIALPRDGLKGCRMGRLANESAIADERLRAPIAAYFSHVETAVAQALREAQHDKQIPADTNPDAIATALVAMIQGGYVLSRVHRDPGHIGRTTDGAIGLLRALTTSTPPEAPFKQGKTHR